MSNTTPNQKWAQLASDQSITAAAAALEKNQVHALIVNTGQEAKQKVLELIPAGAEVMTMTSITLDTIGLTPEINESGKYKSVRTSLTQMDREKDGREMQKLGAAPEWSIASIHAVTEEGQIMIASNTGSQLPAAAYGADHVIFVVSTKKIVKNFDEGMKRIYEYTLPLESERAHKAYGVPGSAVNKMLIINHEVKPNRITVIFVKEDLGF
jgi:L-lactate utilization protein LutC